MFSGSGRGGLLFVRHGEQNKCTSIDQEQKREAPHIFCKAAHLAGGVFQVWHVARFGNTPPLRERTYLALPEESTSAATAVVSFAAKNKSQVLFQATAAENRSNNQPCFLPLPPRPIVHRFDLQTTSTPAPKNRSPLSSSTRRTIGPPRGGRTWSWSRACDCTRA